MTPANPLDITAFDLLAVDFLMLQLNFTCERPPIVLETEAFTFWRHLTTGQRALVIIDFTDHIVTRYDHDATNYPQTSIDKKAPEAQERKHSALMDWLLRDGQSLFEAAIVAGTLVTANHPKWMCGHCLSPLISCQCSQPQSIEERETK